MIEVVIFKKPLEGLATFATKSTRASQIEAEEAQLVKHRKMHAGILRPLSPLHIHAVL